MRQTFKKWIGILISDQAMCSLFVVRCVFMVRLRNIHFVDCMLLMYAFLVILILCELVATFHWHQKLLALRSSLNLLRWSRRSNQYYAIVWQKFIYSFVSVRPCETHFILFCFVSLVLTKSWSWRVHLYDKLFSSDGCVIKWVEGNMKMFSFIWS